MTSSQVAPFDRFDLTKQAEAERPPPRVVIIGEPGVGKTTLASCAEDVILIPTERGAQGITVPKLPTDGVCETWQDVLTSARVLRDREHNFKWVALDTINGAERLCSGYVCHRDFGGLWNTSKGKEGYNSFGKGDAATAFELRELLVILDELQSKRGMGIILLAHLGLHKQGNALGADYFKFGAEMTKKGWPLVCSWADIVGHACRETVVSTEKEKAIGKAAAIGSERWIVFEGGPGRDAKSRAGYEMPARIPLSWDAFTAALNADRLGELAKQALDLLGGAPPEFRDVVSRKLNAEISEKSLRAAGARKLEQLIGWLLASQNNKEQ